MTVDFFNHETKHSGLSEGFEPTYQTQFSFKNGVDDFYIQYLEKNVMTLEFFVTRAQNAVKVGTAKVLLGKVLERDSTFQAQEIVYDPSGGDMGFVIGKVIYKMRMRKSMDEALRWYQQKRALKVSKDPSNAILATKQVGAMRSKVVTIQILKCLGLKSTSGKEMQPFFYF